MTPLSPRRGWDGSEGSCCGMKSTEAAWGVQYKPAEGRFQPVVYKAWPFIVTSDTVILPLGLLRELRPRPTQKEVPLSIIYKGTQLDATQRLTDRRNW